MQQHFLAVWHTLYYHQTSGLAAGRPAGSGRISQAGFWSVWSSTSQTMQVFCVALPHTLPVNAHTEAGPTYTRHKERGGKAVLDCGGCSRFWWPFLPGALGCTLPGAGSNRTPHCSMLGCCTAGGRRNAGGLAMPAQGSPRQEAAVAARHRCCVVQHDVAHPCHPTATR